jgi:hypothetical protein
MTLLERRQKKAIESLMKRRTAAQEFIALHTARLDEKLQPYRDEITIVETMLEQQGVNLDGDSHA